MMQVIFHADDAGCTPAVTERILIGWRQGWLDGFSIIANGEACELVRRDLSLFADRSAMVGVHLNLSEGKPSSGSLKNSPLVNSDGILKNTFGDILRLWLTTSRQRRLSLLDEIREEWRLQIREVKSLVSPRTVSCLDGHNHVHMLPFLFPLAASLAFEESIPEVRISRESLFFSTQVSESMNFHFMVNVAKFLVLRWCAFRAAPVARDMQLKSPDALVGVLYSGMMSPGAVRAAIRRAKTYGIKRAEVVFHIGRALPSEASRWNHLPSARAFFLSPDRDSEFQALQEIKGTVHNEA